MKKEEKELLIKDLCARLPYKPQVQIIKDGISITDKLTTATIKYLECGYWDVKPYLFPLSSMTDEQAKEMQEIVGSPKDACIIRKTGGLELWLDSIDTDPTIWLDTIFEVQDWLNKNHFDYRGLIEKLLALDATNLNI